MRGLRARSGDGSHVDLGPLLSGLLLAGIMAGVGSFSTVAVLAYRANASDEQVEKIENRQRVIDRNQVVLDANQRELLRDSEWTQSKLDALLRERDIPVPAKPPKPDSSLEPTS